MLVNEQQKTRSNPELNLGRYRKEIENRVYRFCYQYFLCFHINLESQQRSFQVSELTQKVDDFTQSLLIVLA